ncbi:serine/threonine-protein kinase [Streptosporangium sp. NBC_01469]|uniref:serine/threonine-protein kinase n=1 Tax=Streptosporangium sp. NBC_01469 TaxID=2903898 RepID=UPI002E27CB1D|nr:serine/threonine-protein kinase [Streptosporangium sp. NBC_01469]
MSSSRYEGWLLAGRYRLVAGLGRGGMATVWRARDELLGRGVAVKEVVLPDHAGPEREVLLERTMREARLAARLSHPNIAAVYDVVRADDRLWIVMQLVRSRNLAEVIAEEGPLPAPAIARVGLEVLSALEAAHAAGVMHRDVKPANILLTDDGHAILTDFGLATAVDEDVSLTRTGMVVGTPAYIAPERAGGVASSAESDLWSFGATLYAAAEGRSAFGRSTALATLAAVLTADPEPFRHAGPLAPVITGLLDKDPARRTDVARARRQLGDVAALWERGADSTAAPFLATRVAAPPVDRNPTGPTGLSEVDGRSTGRRFHEDANRRFAGHLPREDADRRLTDRHPREEVGPTSTRQRVTKRRRLSAGVAVLTVAVLAAAVTAERRGGGSGPPERVAPSGGVPVTAPQPTRTPETRQVLDEGHLDATPRRGGRADAAPAPTAAESSGTGEKEANPNSNRYKTKDKNKGYKPTQRGNGRGNSKNH